VESTTAEEEAGFRLGWD